MTASPFVRAAERLAALGEPWPEPAPLPPLLPTAPEPEPLADYMPANFAPWAADTADRLDVPPCMIAAPALLALAGVVGRSHAIRPKRLDAWAVPPILWGAIVGRPSTKKSPAIEAALEPLEEIERTAREEWERGRPAREAALARLKAREAALREELKRGSGAGRSASDARAPGEIETDLEEALREVEAAERAGARRRIRIADSTTEKVGELLIENPRGLLLVRDELAGWVAQLDRTDRPGDRAFYLQAWGGQPYDVDRIGRGSLYVPALAVSIIGGLQPSRLAPLVDATARGGLDGFLARFQVIVWPEERGRGRYVDRAPDLEARERAFAAFRALDMAARDALATGAPRSLRFAPDAQDLFREAFDDLSRSLESDQARACPGFDSHLAKFDRLLPAIALLLELADNPRAEAVGIRAAVAALRWRDLFEAHARKVYSAILAPEVTAAHALAAKLRSGAIEDGAPVRAIYRNGWAGLADADRVEAGLDELERMGWVRLETVGTAGRPRRVVRVNPATRKASP